MDLQHALAIAQADAARLHRFIERRERFLDALDWSLLSEAHANEGSMLDALLANDAADASLYTEWLTEQIATGEEGVVGVLRFTPAPRPWHSEWITTAG